MIFGKSAELFRRTQEILDKLNRIINESIIASALIRVVNGQYEEVKKFSVAVGEAKENSLKILALFASLVPLINFLANLSILGVSF
jgi:ATP-binding cassette subfamily B protein